MASSLSNDHEEIEACQKILGAIWDSKPKTKVSKKYKLPRGHFTKELLLQKHQDLLDHSYKTSLAPGLQITRHDPISCAKVTVFGKQDLKNYENSYTAIKIRDLIPGVVNRERIVYAKTIVDVVMESSIHTVIKDESRHGGYCKMCIYNLPEEHWYQFARGTKLAILNPYYKKGGSSNFLRVDNPTEIITIQAPGTPGGSAPSLLPIEHKQLGNKLFKEKRFTEALDAYTHAIMGDRQDPVFYSNRSLCHSQIGQFEAALSDATTAVGLNPDEPKFKYRVSAAWSGLGNHEKASDILKQLIHSAQDNHATIEYQDKLRIEKAYLRQETGEIDLKDVEQIVFAGVSVKMADYIGPIELKQSSMKGCAERGLFATRDLQQGEVICVSKAAVYLGDFISKPSDSYEISSDSMSPPFLVLVTKLIQKMNVSKLFTHRILNIVEHEKFSKKSPFYTNIELYRGNGYDMIKDLPSPQFSVENIRFAAHIKGLGSIIKGSNNMHDFSDSEEIYNTPGAMKYGIWFISSLLNHSCAGNVVRVAKGEVCVLKVFKDVKKGEELLMSSFEGAFYKDFKARKKFLEKTYGYTCNCLLCKRENEVNIKPLLAQVSILFDQAFGLWNRHATTRTRPPDEEYREYVTRGIELAEALGLGPQTFYGPLWSTFINLATIFKAEVKDQLFLYEKTQKYLSELELYHQYSYWEYYCKLCLMHFGPLDRRTMQACSNFNKFDRIFLWKN